MEWVVRDAGVLDDVLRLFQPLNELEPEREVLQARQEQLGLEEAALDQECERLEDELEAFEGRGSHPVTDSARNALNHRHIELRSRIRALEVRERKLGAAERALDVRSDELEKRAVSALWVLVDQAIANGRGRSVGCN